MIKCGKCVKGMLLCGTSVKHGKLRIQEYQGMQIIAPRSSLTSRFVVVWGFSLMFSLFDVFFHEYSR